jgi:hypothetical protein
MCCAQLDQQSAAARETTKVLQAAAAEQLHKCEGLDREVQRLQACLALRDAKLTAAVE